MKKKMKKIEKQRIEGHLVQRLRHCHLHARPGAELDDNANAFALRRHADGYSELQTEGNEMTSQTVDDVPPSD